MHIADGLLPAKVYIGGYAIAGLVTWYSLTQIDRQPNPRADIPKASLLTAAFFIASSIHLPLPPTSVHLILNGLLGAILGYYAFPAILIGLVFQAVMFGHGGFISLGINALILGMPALLADRIFQLRHFIYRKTHRLFRLNQNLYETTQRVSCGDASRAKLKISPAETLREQNSLTSVFAFLAGASGVGLAAAIFSLLVMLTLPADIDRAAEQAAIFALLLAHLPLMAIEGAFTAMLVAFLCQVKPDLVR